MLAILSRAVETCSLVLLMMVLVEWVNIRSRGHWEAWLAGSVWKQYLVASFLGATPGCLGAYAVAAMYSHRVVGFGALLAAMVATCGDESFFLLAMAPSRAMFLFTLLFVLGILAAALADRLPARLLEAPNGRHRLELHEAEAAHGIAPGGNLARILLALVLAAGVAATLTGHFGDAASPWMRFMLAAAMASGLYVVLTCSGHFIEHHIIQHVLRSHALRLLAWTLGAFAAMEWLSPRLETAAVDGARVWAALGLGAITGLLPESGPHLVFVTLVVNGALPFAVLLVNSIVQDGHAMLPLLAESQRTFLAVKTVKLVFGLAAGVLFLLLERTV